MKPPQVQMWLLIIDLLPSFPTCSLSIIPKTVQRANIIPSVDMKKCGPQAVSEHLGKALGQGNNFPLLLLYHIDTRRPFKSGFKDLRKRPYTYLDDLAF